MSHLSVVPTWDDPSYRVVVDGDDVLVLMDDGLDDEDEADEFDAVSHRILDLLRQSVGSKGMTRYTVAELGRKMSLDHEEVWEHLEELLALGYIQRTHVYGVFTLEDTAPAPLPPPKPAPVKPGPKPKRLDMGEPLPDPFPVPPLIVAMNVIARMRVDRGRPEMTAEELLPTLEAAADCGLSPEFLARTWFTDRRFDPRDPTPVKRFVNHVKSLMAMRP